MSRIFISLAILAVVLLCANLMVGLTVGDLGASSRTYQAAYHHYGEAVDANSDRETLKLAESELQAAGTTMFLQRSKFWIHIWLGMGAALITLLVCSISVTYFIGTNRWCQEVVDAFSLDKNYSVRSQRIKYRAFPWSIVAVLLIIVIAGLGAASDPVTLNPEAADFVNYHMGLAMLGIVVIAASLSIQFTLIRKNYGLIKEILAAADQERERRKAARAK